LGVPRRFSFLEAQSMKSLAERRLYNGFRWRRVGPSLQVLAWLHFVAHAVGFTLLSLTWNALRTFREKINEFR